MKVSRRRLNDAVVKSPMNGTINQRYVELGSLIAPNVPLFDIVNSNQLKVVCNISEAKVQQLSVGQSVEITTSNVPSTVFSGKIHFIGIKTDRGLNYPVEIVIDKNDKLRVGMYVKVNFASQKEKNGILLPRKAIIGSVKSANVFIYKDGKAVKQDITVGDMIGDRVEVLTGIKSGDAIIISGIMNVADGTLVEPINKIAL